MKILWRDPDLDGISLYASPNKDVVCATAYYRVTYEEKVPGKKYIRMREKIEKGSTLQVGDRHDMEGAHLKQLIQIAAGCAETIRRACWAQDEKIAKKVKNSKKTKKCVQ